MFWFLVELGSCLFFFFTLCRHGNILLRYWGTSEKENIVLFFQKFFIENVSIPKKFKAKSQDSNKIYCIITPDKQHDATKHDLPVKMIN